MAAAAAPPAGLLAEAAGYMHIVVKTLTGKVIKPAAAGMQINVQTLTGKHLGRA